MRTFSYKNPAQVATVCVNDVPFWKLPEGAIIERVSIMVAAKDGRTFEMDTATMEPVETTGRCNLEGSCT